MKNNPYSREEIRQTVVDIVSRILDRDPSEITEEKELDQDLRIDSLALYEIVVDIEEHYSLMISNDEADDLKTVGEAIDFIVSKIGQAQ
jgi:acyl carrier protein